MVDPIDRTQARQCLSGISPGLSIEGYAKFVDDRLKALPGLTVYGYDMNVILRICDVMKMKRIGPSEAIDMLSDAQCLVSEVYADIERTQRKALGEMIDNWIREEWKAENGH